MFTLRHLTIIYIHLHYRILYLNNKFIIYICVIYVTNICICKQYSQYKEKQRGKILKIFNYLNIIYNQGLLIRLIYYRYQLCTCNYYFKVGRYKRVPYVF